MTEWLGVDTHVHLGAYDDPAAELEHSTRAGVRVFASTTLASEYRRLAATLPPTHGLELGLGVHPLHADSPDIEQELAVFAEEFPRARWISEIGLDGFFARGDGPGLAAQRHVFETILAAGVGDRILSVHSREAEDLSAELVLAAAPAAAVFHWYDGTVAQARPLADAGYLFSVNAFMVQSAAHEELLRWLPRDLLITETDGPTTTMPSGAGTHPADVIEIARLLAVIRGDEVDALRRQLVANAERVDAAAPPRG